MGNRRREERRDTNGNGFIECFLDSITDLLMVLNYFKMNISYETLMECNLDELNYWILRADQLAEEEKERQEEMNNE